MTSGPRAATPADAKAAWESMEAPTVRGVATALMQAGFAKISFKTIHRWHEGGWAHKERRGTRMPALDEAAKVVDVNVPVLTGDATTRLKDIVPPAKETEPASSAGGLSASSERVASSDDALPIDGVAEKNTLSKMADNALMKLAAREAYITTVMLMRCVQRKMSLVESAPREVGSLQSALAGSLTAANQAIEQVMKLEALTLDAAPTASGEPSNDLTDAMAAFQKARGGG